MKSLGETAKRKRSVENYFKSLLKINASSRSTGRKASVLHLLKVQCLYFSTQRIPT